MINRLIIHNTKSALTFGGYLNGESPKLNKSSAFYTKEKVKILVLEGPITAADKQDGRMISKHFHAKKLILPVNIFTFNTTAAKNVLP